MNAQLTRGRAEQWAALALANVRTAYPYKLDQVLTCDADARAPASLHPVFWGSYDWHSSVHMHWTLVRLARRFPDHALAPATHGHLRQRLTPDNLSWELAALARPHNASFERPYGWAWVLKLAAEARRLAAEQPDAAMYAEALAPLARTIADRFVEYLPRVDYPTRSGTHGNTAFALLLALDYSATFEHQTLVGLIAERAVRWFAADRRYPAHYEPAGEDFLSPGLVEAALMRRVVGRRAFADWWHPFAPDAESLATWMAPAPVSDATDPKIVHLHGLNLSRVWCWRQLLGDLEPALALQVRHAIDAHLAASLDASGAGHYVGTHWLASFALLALDDA